ncbi:MAG: tetratricopeptide repeat protein [Methylacidiphilales bacterium]|nr:tetratricopeptide repeat protein [Candidatus Methylacidiphilales bacterium]
MSRKKKNRSQAFRAAPSALAEKSPPLEGPPPPRSASPARSPILVEKGSPLWIIGLIVLVILLVYSNSFTGPFLFDDDQAIMKNYSIEHLWPPWAPLDPPCFLTVGGRPLLNLSFAINYAINGRSGTWSYHALNVLVHILAGLTLLGVLRRTFLQPVLRARFGSAALPLAVAATLLWMLDPLQTECVAYISQRAEALMGLCYLLTIYCFIRATEPQTIDPRRWFFLAVLSCTAGAAFKEIIITAPVMVLLYDRTFVTGTFLQAWRRRWRFYLVLAVSCWLVFIYGVQDIKGYDNAEYRIVEICLAAPIVVFLFDGVFFAGTFLPALRRRWGLYLVLAVSCWLFVAYGVQDTKGHENPQGRIVGYQFGVTGWDYALTECPAIVHYLALMVWPHPLIIDYGLTTFHIRHEDSIDYAILVFPDLIANHALLDAITVVVLLAATLVALVRWPLIGFAGAWFFLILAPTSSFIPIVVSPQGEHRLYLPLLAFLVPLVLVLRHFLGTRFWFPVIALCAVYGVLTFLRNEDYSTDVNFWKVAISQEPGNARAHNNYGVTLLGAKRPAEAAAQFQEATTIQHNYADAHYNWGNATAELGHYQEAVTHYQVALQQKPTLASAQNNWGNVLSAMGPEHYQEATVHYLMALQLDPNNVQFHYNLGHSYLLLNKLPEALEQFNEALQINPNLAVAHNTRGIVYFQMGAKQQAIEEFQEALRLDPNLQQARDNLNKVEAPAQPTGTGVNKSNTK